VIHRPTFPELRKLIARRRTWLGFGAFAAIELLMPALFKLQKVQASFRLLIESRGYSFDEYFSGLTLALLTMRTTVFFVGTLFLAMIAGEIVAKEAEDGTLRMLFCRPVTRFRVLLQKYLAVFFYTAALVGFVGITALGAGLAYAGPGNFFAFGFQDHTSTFHLFRDGLIRYLTVLPLLSMSLLTVTSFAFMCSCFDIKPVSATIGTLSLFFVDFVFRGFPLFESIQSWFITMRMSAWMLVFQPQIPWAKIAGDYTLLLALDASCFVIGWLAFEQRDLKS
jgi:ABC-2 type transport system permease protein